jgi:hypothetical protein
VVPVSAMAVVVGGEGASVAVTWLANLCGSGAQIRNSLGGLAVPLSYLGLGPQTLVDPPFLSFMVASSSCPSALFSHILLVCFTFLLLPWVQQ